VGTAENAISAKMCERVVINITRNTSYLEVEVPFIPTKVSHYLISLPICVTAFDCHYGIT
jgi:amino acid permease